MIARILLRNSKSRKKDFSTCKQRIARHQLTGRKTLCGSRSGQWVLLVQMPCVPLLF
jgi:hypothetical protein